MLLTRHIQNYINYEFSLIQIGEISFLFFCIWTFPQNVLHFVKGFFVGSPSDFRKLCVPSRAVSQTILALLLLVSN